MTHKEAALLKALNLNSNKIHNSTGLSVYHINNWMGGAKDLPDYVDMTLNSFIEEIESEFDKVKTKLNLN